MLSKLRALSLGLGLLILSAVFGALAWSSTNLPDDTDFAPMSIGRYVDEGQDPGQQETFQVFTQQFTGADLQPLLPAYPVDGTIEMLSPRCLTKGLDLSFEFFMAPTEKVAEPQRQIAFEPFAFSPGCAFGSFPWVLDYTAAGLPELEDDETLEMKQQLSELTEPTEYTLTEKVSADGSQAEVFRSEPVWLIPVGYEGFFSLVERTLDDPFFDRAPEFEAGTSARRLPFALTSLAAGLAGFALIWVSMRRHFAELAFERDVAVAARATAEERRDTLAVILNATHHELNREITMIGFAIDDLADEGASVTQIRETHARLEAGRDEIAVLAQLGTSRHTSVQQTCSAEDLRPDGSALEVSTNTVAAMEGVDKLLIRAMVRTIVRNIETYGGASRLRIETTPTQLRMAGDAANYSGELLQELWESSTMEGATDGGARDLALIKRIVEAHGGAAHFQTQADGDIQLTFALGADRPLDLRDTSSNDSVVQLGASL